MAEPITYKKPRRINIVSVTLVLALALAAYAAYQFLPLYFQKQEVYRVLEETSSAFSGKRSLYVEDPSSRETLRRNMENDIRNIGVDDPELETWIEVDGTEVRFGAVYSKWVEWPLGIVARQEHVYEVEHKIAIPR
jgi:hypothetical protein